MGVVLPRESGLAASAAWILGLNLGGLRALLIVRCSGGRGTLIGRGRLTFGGLRALLIVRRSGGRGTLANLVLET